MPSGGLPGGGQTGGSQSGGPGAGSSGPAGGSNSGDGTAGSQSGGGLLGGDAGGDAEPSWEIPEAGGGADGGWETSNELPGAGNAGRAGAAANGDPANGDPANGDPAGGYPPKDGTGNPSAGGENDDPLEGALGDLDGEILSERDILRSGNAGTAGGVQIPAEGPDAPASGAAGQRGGQVPAPRPMPPAPAPPRREAASLPDDLPDARDDDIIARQLREAAMQEQDPELREKLWEEYRKYKRG